jgi:hypothetical protein
MASDYLKIFFVLFVIIPIWLEYTSGGSIYNYVP